jgi:hypothetical protein
VPAIAIVLIAFAVSYPLFNNDLPTFGKVIERLLLSPSAATPPVPKK